jgi:uncharacterized protein YraI
MDAGVRWFTGIGRRTEREEWLMSHRLALTISGIMLCTGVTSQALAQTSYEAVVTKDKVNVRSGPSENYYATGLLERDTRVTVVREEENGWLAIEPPEGSFSWIAGEYIREISPTEGELTANDVVVRIGTPTNSQKRDSIQKKLSRGDRVRILDKTTSGEERLAKVYYKILPPAGEVRYIIASAVHSVSGRRPTSRSASSGPSAGSSLPPPRDLGTDDAEPATNRSARGRPIDESEEDEDATPPRASQSKSPRTPLERAEAAYQTMMQKILPDRDIATVRTLYERAAQSARNDAEHRLIAQRLESLQMQEERKSRFADFDRALKRSRQRDDALLSIPRRGRNEESDDDRDARDAREPQRDGGGASGETPVRYDASGTLRRSTVIIDGKPAYVLLSPQGGIRYYVSAAPGLDLNKYLDRVVAVRGASSYRVEVRAQHITVRDVTVIELNPAGYREANPERGNKRS